MKPSYADDEVKLDALTTALRKVPSETLYYLDYIQDHRLDFSRACAYLRERALLKSTFDDGDAKKFHNATTEDHTKGTGNSNATLDFAQVYAIMQNWAEETDLDLKHVYSTMNASPPLRKSLMIPSKLWKKLAPEIKKAVLDAQAKVMKEEASQLDQNEDPQKSKGGLPKQYSSRANLASTHVEEDDECSISSHKRHVMMSTREWLRLSAQLLASDMLDSEESYKSYSYMARTINISDSFVLNRNLFNASLTQPVAFVDGGADSCIGGIGWTPIVYTGRKANLVGYDDRHTKKSGLDICTLLTKVKPATNEEPILLVAHEMIYNPGSSTSLISESK